MQNGLKTIFSYLSTTILFFNIFYASLANANSMLCNGPYVNKKLSTEEVITLSKKSEQLNLCGADLSNLDLTNINLETANLSNVNFTNTILKNANLQQANLYNANLTSVDLNNARLQKANLELACLNLAKLENANLQEARLQTALMSNASFVNAILTLADLDKIHAKHAIFTNAEMSFCSIQDANLNFARLDNANLYASNLRSTKFSKAILQHTKFINANLENTDFSMADLSFATLKNANIKNTVFYLANIFHMDYRPQYNTTPDIISLATANNFNTIEFYDKTLKTLPMLELRAAYRHIGLTDMERLTTAMIKKAELTQELCKGSLAKIKSFICYVLFEFTCNYGSTPIKALQLMFYFMLLFAIPYWAALHYASKIHGIIRIDINNNQTRFKKIKWYYPIKALYFSILNTLNIGCGNCKLAKFITALQQEDYELMPIGIIRTIAGIQMLISTYLFVIWILTYFGDPFGI